MSGSIALIQGPMFGGKTTELMRRLKRYAINPTIKTLLIKYEADLRHESSTATMLTNHDNWTSTARPFKGYLMTIVNELKQYDVVGIDEGQFYPDIREVAEKLASEGKQVIISALNVDFRGVPFESLRDLVPEENVLLPSVCQDCYNQQAIYSVTRDPRIAAELILEKTNVKLGGAETWKVLCRGCRPAYQTAFLKAYNDVKAEHTTRMQQLLADRTDRSAQLRNEAAAQYKQQFAATKPILAELQ